MECNKNEAKRAMDVAEKKLSENDYIGANKFVTKAQNLYPDLDGLNQVLMMIHVYISAAATKIKGGTESDLYGVLGVDPLADDEALKKQYKKMALLLHPDKNKCKGAEGAFKLVSNAWSLLSDKAKKSAYDQRRKLSTGMQQKPPAPNQHNKPPGSNSKVDPNAKAGSYNQPPPASGPQRPPPPYAPWPAYCNVNQNGRAGVDPNGRASGPQRPPPKPSASSSANQSGNTRSNKPTAAAPSSTQKFWTMCNGCKTRSECRKDLYLNKAMRCHNCGQTYIATEQNPWDRYVTYLNNALSVIGQRQQLWTSAQNQPTNHRGGASSSSSSSPFVGTTKNPWESYVTQVNYTLSLVVQRQQEWIAQKQEGINNTNGAAGTSSSFPYVNATPQDKFVLQKVYSTFSLVLELQQQWSAAAANNNGTPPSARASVVRPGVNLSSSSPQQRQWSAKSQKTNGASSPSVTAKAPQGSFVSPGGVNHSSSSPQQQQWGTSGGTYYPSSSGSFHNKCSVSSSSVPASSSSGNQAQETQRKI